MKDFWYGLNEVIWYLLTLPVRIYIVTWSYLLILTKRRIPKWLIERTKDELTYQPLGKPEKYNR